MLTRLQKLDDARPTVLEAASFVSERFGFVYHVIPKTLSRAMLEYLAGVDPSGYRIVDRRRGIEVLDAMPRRADFSFVRNPYSRAVAVYYDKFANYHDAPGQRELIAKHGGLRHDMTLPEFIAWLATDDGSDARVDPHFLSQHYFLLDPVGHPAVDFIGRVESATEHVPELQRALGLPVAALPRRNSNATRRGVRVDTAARWREELDETSVQILNARYDADFELLGYPRLPYRVTPRFSDCDASKNPSGHAVGPAARPVTFRGRILATANRVLARLGLQLARRPRPRGEAPSP